MTAIDEAKRILAQYERHDVVRIRAQTVQQLIDIIQLLTDSVSRGTEDAATT
jgi:hypothetical protein